MTTTNWSFVAAGIGHIPLRDREGNVKAWTLVDAGDFLHVGHLNWHLSTSGYACRFHGGRLPKRITERLHRRILGLPQGDKRQADHINRNKLDNRRCNLRITSGDAQNKQNVPGRGGTSRYRGVSFDSTREVWLAQAKCEGKRLMKRFAKEDEAAAAVKAWRAEHMPFATD